DHAQKQKVARPDHVTAPGGMFFYVTTVEHGRFHVAPSCIHRACPKLAACSRVPLLMTRPIEPPPLPPLPPPLPSSRHAPFAGPVRPARPATSDGDGADDPPYPPPLPDRHDSDAELPPPPLPQRRRSRNEIEMFFAGVEWIFGFFCVIGGLAVLAALPVLQFL